MTGRRSGVSQQGETQWIGFTDMIAGLFGVFIIIFCMAVQRAMTAEEAESALATELAKSNDLDSSERLLKTSIQIPGELLFESGRAELTLRGRDELDRAAAEIGHLPRFRDDSTSILLVEGFTDDQSVIGGRFESNWDLSTQRAVEVVRHLELLAPKGVRIPGERIAAVGLSKYHPRASNATEVGRRRNRYIQMIVVQRDALFPGLGNSHE